MACKSGYTSPRISSEYPDCSLPLTFDSYNICGFGFGKKCSGCLYCALKGSKVTMANGIKLEIEKIKQGDKVFSINIEGNFKREVSEVKAIMSREVKEIYKITFPSNRKSLFLTGEHPVYTQEGWKEVKDLIVGIDNIRQFNYFSKIKSIKKLQGNYAVFNIETYPNNNYVIENKLVHNCFSNSQKINHPMYEKKAFQVKSVNPNKTIGMLNGTVKSKYYDNFFKYRFPLHWGGLADPFCYMEEKEGVGLKILQGASKIQYPIIFSTKGTFMTRDKDYLKVFESYKETKNLGFSFSIITNEKHIAKRIERNVPSVEDRLKAMKVLSDLGFWTVLRLRPFMLGITDINLETLLERAKKAGARAVSTEFFCLDLRSLSTLKERLDAIDKISGLDYRSYYKALSPGSRGTYLRLNRLVKEYYMKRLLIKCKELDLKVSVSDPDFKEYNFSGNCCGYPESKKEFNSEICNWSRGQLTYHIRKLRKKYWAGERPALLTWDEVKNTIANDWASDGRYFKDSIKYWSTDFRKKQQSHIDEFLETWNGTKSSASPYNYFDGLLVPHTLDEKDNIVYRYEPSDSELRLRKEGVV